MTTALQRLRWCLALLSPSVDLTHSSQESLATFLVCVGLLSVCLVAGVFVLIGAI
jgi:hypothetical protein